MRQCPNCGYRDPPYWRPAKMHNPSGDIDICRIDDLLFNEVGLGKAVNKLRGTVVKDPNYAYYLGKRGVWVRRVALQIFQDCGMQAFKPPFEGSKHNPLEKNVSGRTKTTWVKGKGE